MRTLRCLLSTRALAGMLTLVSPVLMAQTPPPAKAEAETVKLSPFEVTALQDIGYSAANAVTATKLDVPLANLPVNVSVFTEDLLTDLNVANVKEAFIYNASSSSFGNFRLRGFEAGREIVDGFRITFNYPAVMFQRAEIMKGPAGVMYGRSSPGGIKNYVRKQPVEGRDAYSLSLGTGDINGNTRLRAVADVNQSAGRFTYRIIAGHADFEDSGSSHAALAHGSNRWALVYPTLSFRPFVNTKVTLGYVNNHETIRSQDGAHSARGRTINNIPIPILYPQVDPYLDLGWGRRYDTWTEDKFILVDQRVNDSLSFRVGFQRHDREAGNAVNVINTAMLVNQVTAAGVPVLGAGGAPAQRPVVRQGFRREFNGTNQFDDLQAYGVYKFEALKTKHQVLFGYQRNVSEDKGLDGWIARNSNNQTSAAVLEGPGFFFQNPSPSTEYFRYVFFLDQPVPRDLPRDFVRAPVINTSYTTDDFATWTLNWLSTALDDKLNLMAGVSYNDYLGMRADGKYDVTETTPQVGALYKLTRELSVFGLFSRSMDLTHRRDGWDRPFGPIVGSGSEGGLKLDLLQGRLSGTITGFEMKNQDIVVFDPNANNQTYERTQQPTDRGAWVQVGEITTTGLEADVLFSAGPRRQYELRLSYAYLDAETTQDTNRANIGMTPPGHIRHGFSAWNRYTFTTGPLKNLYFGAGYIKRTGEMGGGNLRGEGFDRWDALAGYTFRLLDRVNTRVSVNVQNLFEESSSISGRSGVNPATRRPFKFEMPRQVWIDFHFGF